MTTEGMVTLAELLEDRIYAKWFAKPPRVNQYTSWRVYAQRKRGKRWRKKDFQNWADAHKYLMRHLDEWYNASLSCRNQEYRPPVVRFQGQRRYYAKMLLMEAHVWCPYCRRPTMFGYFTRHHTFPKGGTQPQPQYLRCGVCGIREIAIRQFSKVLLRG